MTRRQIFPGVVIVAIVLATSSAGAITTRAAGTQYERDVASANVALATFDSQIDGWTNSTADAVGERQATRLLDVLTTLRANLLRQSWPSSVSGGVRFLCDEDISSLQEDLREIDANSSLGSGAFQLTFRFDSMTIDAHAFYLRKDLGLPGSREL